MTFLACGGGGGSGVGYSAGKVNAADGFIEDILSA